MATDDEDAVRLADEHIRETWQRLAAGRTEIERQRESIAETKRHLTGMSHWIEQTESQLARFRERGSDR
jgi:predicted  nucleic acid-binding Zn-ribbon protein